MNQSKFVPALAVMFSLVLLVGCSGGETEVAEEAAEGADHEHDQFSGLVVEEPLVGELTWEENWEDFDVALRGTPATDGSGLWIVEAQWFRIEPQPDTLFTYEGMFQLEADGVINEKTKIGTVAYRFTVEPADRDEAKQMAKDAKNGPMWPPQRVWHAMGVQDEPGGN